MSRPSLATAPPVAAHLTWRDGAAGHTTLPPWASQVAPSAGSKRPWSAVIRLERAQRQVAGMLGDVRLACGNRIVKKLHLVKQLRGGCGATQTFDDDDFDDEQPPALVRVVGGAQQLDQAEPLPVIEGGRLTVGRGEDAMLELTDGERGEAPQLVHSKHAEVIRSGGAYYLIVLGTQMVTRVEGIAYRNVASQHYRVPQIHLESGTGGTGRTGVHVGRHVPQRTTTIPSVVGRRR